MLIITVKQSNNYLKIVLAIADNGVIELEGAGMNVFERKSKEKAPAAEGEKVVNK